MESYWSNPHISKIYEALTAIADNRIQFTNKENSQAECYSSSKGKYYEIAFDQKSMAMMSNDNTAYYTGSLSYPMIAVLMLKGILRVDSDLIKTFRGIHWKDINQKFKNDYDKSIEYVLEELAEKEENVTQLKNEINSIYNEVNKLKIAKLGRRKLPPKGY